MTFVDQEEAGDRDRLRRWLDAMSAKARGASATEATVEDLAPTEPFRTPDDDDPDVPVGPEEEDPHDHGDDPESVAHTVQRSQRSSYAWGDHQNGRIPTKALKAIGQGSHKLETFFPAADAWLAMRAAAAEDIPGGALDQRPGPAFTRC